MKKFYASLVLIGFLFLATTAGTVSAETSAQHLTKKYVAKKKQGHKKARGHAAKGSVKRSKTTACTSKDVLMVAKGSKLLARGKGTPALKRAYKKMLVCSKKVKGKETLPKPYQSFVKALKAACTKKTASMKKVFAKTCAGHKRTSAAVAKACTSKDVLMVAKGAKLLARGKGTPALKRAYKKMLMCYKKVKGQEPLPKSAQSFVKALKKVCAKRASNSSINKVFAKTCGKKKVVRAAVVDDAALDMDVDDSSELDVGAGDVVVDNSSALNGSADNMSIDSGSDFGLDDNTDDMDIDGDSSSNELPVGSQVAAPLPTMYSPAVTYPPVAYPPSVMYPQPQPYAAPVPVAPVEPVEPKKVIISIGNVSYPATIYPQQAGGYAQQPVYAYAG